MASLCGVERSVAGQDSEICVLEPPRVGRLPVEIRLEIYRGVLETETPEVRAKEMPCRVLRGCSSMPVRIPCILYVCILYVLVKNGDPWPLTSITPSGYGFTATAA